MRRGISVAIALVLLLGMLSPSAGAQSDEALLRKRAQVQAILEQAVRVNGHVGAIVLLKDEPLVAYRGTIRGLAATSVAVAPENQVQGKLDVASARSRAYAAYLQRQQDLFLTKVHQWIPEATVHHRYQVLLNGLALTVPAEKVELLAAFSDVVEIFPIVEVFPGLASVVPGLIPPLDTSHALMGAEELWGAVGGRERAGLGVKIGIVDTGVDFNHPMFQDATLVPPPGFPKTNTNEGLANGKVIVAKVFQSVIDRQVRLDPRLRTAQDLNGHGTHVASCAAGNIVDLTNLPGTRPVVISGVAPKAFLGSYRVCAPRCGLDSLLAGIEEAVRDGMDVINLSLGARTNTLLDRAAANAVLAGVVVVAAVGNEGPPTPETQNVAGGTVRSPANAERVIGVGATTNAHQGAAASALGRVRLLEPPPPPELSELLGFRGMNGASPFPETSLRAPLRDVDLVDNGVADGGGLACEPLPAGSLAGAIALIQRGQCPFATKNQNAAMAGAIAVLIYNSEAGGDTFITPNLNGAPLPTLFLQRRAGLALKQFVVSNERASRPTRVALERLDLPDETIVTLAIEPHHLADFSSRGPASSFAIKPDVVAPGMSSYAAVQDDDPRGDARFPIPPGVERGLEDPVYDPSGFAFRNGTSFAAPRVAGVAALLKQLRPGWTPDEIRSAILTTARRPPQLEARRVMDRGVGLVDMRALARVLTTVDSPTHSFGAIRVQQPITRTKTFTVKNHSSRLVTYRLSLTMTNADPAIAATLNKTAFQVRPGGTGQFTLTLRISPTVAAGDWEGIISVSDDGTTIPGQLSIPFWVRTVR
ncbi:MAG: S8 family serine peptidase [Blastocatellia bacterium]|nr:S8 family serine peptidase [Blastocatellia bacterium]MCS7157331.1 S8 family serine peptidase [Blastocatellia bacterium]MCX7753197.1 S8 family serine peptidase [Blastocatellia bacterium]MDW8168235.1 S8 family serine peptidase [Acidobacteriota bacterium]MDW8255471.1 S8 family serine peptidase [Acidobacteriota bacterium]